nr:MAG TPA: hypothetical protein [Caudoviricetes sp.]
MRVYQCDCYKGLHLIAKKRSGAKMDKECEN